MTAKATASVNFSVYTAIPVTFSFDPLFQSTQFAYLFPNLTLNTLPTSAKIIIVIIFLLIFLNLERDNHKSKFSFR